MEKIYKILLLVLVLISLTVFAVLKYVNKPANDFSDKDPVAHFTFTDIMKSIETDTAKVNQLKDKLISITANVKKINNEQNDITLELGDSNTLSSIICQADKRHSKDFSAIKTGDPVRVKGILTGYSVDLELGLGNTIEMNYCTTLK